MIKLSVRSVCRKCVDFLMASRTHPEGTETWFEKIFMNKINGCNATGPHEFYL